MAADLLPPVDHRSCRLLGPTALIVQAIMGVLVVASLLLKRTRERPRRPWKIWLGDFSKQVMGQAFLHASNVLISDVIAHHARRKENPCSLYFLNILVDTTLGVLILYGVLKLFTRVLVQRQGRQDFQTGFYGEPPSMVVWGKQLLVYLTACAVMKILVVAFFLSVPRIYRLGDWLLSWLGDHPDFQVTFVMAVFPLIMNTLQAMIIDSFIREKHSDETEQDKLTADEEAVIRQQFEQQPRIPDEIVKPTVSAHEGDYFYTANGRKRDSSESARRSAESIRGASLLLRAQPTLSRRGSGASNRSALSRKLSVATHDYPPATEEEVTSPLCSPGGTLRPSYGSIPNSPHPSPLRETVSPHGEAESPTAFIKRKRGSPRTSGELRRSMSRQ
ncbi:uncharacterized protein L969DRAFT_91634 [Mixia osmundae IAM 14324]|uniref:Vaculolar membrane protein-domain-containing protein n=1 Tax=Mixia osmundae (strain CBS 9802 / IAM 14324 / JCM 22182 / KY 12970) TaxID=764103 RepID=G7E018_MIXOS|nr:uncharacterized protein L969DRAFT_91634 [Mixia osmundae IAM 14324]KEI42171.1 hypothetical protein L969DRAFT_91634 [Mixia osmundae IAM 14324]GAA96178.1 hypothetical protein E5Q_02842 [Mixia osmundae IAM 14324]